MSTFDLVRHYNKNWKYTKVILNDSDCDSKAIITTIITKQKFYSIEMI